VWNGIFVIHRGISIVWLRTCRQLNANCQPAPTHFFSAAFPTLIGPTHVFPIIATITLTIVRKLTSTRCPVLASLCANHQVARVSMGSKSCDFTLRRAATWAKNCPPFFWKGELITINLVKTIYKYWSPVIQFLKQHEMKLTLSKISAMFIYELLSNLQSQVNFENKRKEKHSFLMILNEISVKL